MALPRSWNGLCVSPRQGFPARSALRFPSLSGRRTLSCLATLSPAITRDARGNHPSTPSSTNATTRSGARRRSALRDATASGAARSTMRSSPSSTGDGGFTPVPFVDAKAAEQLFRHKAITLLRDEELLTEERIELLLSWRYSGFSAHHAVRIAAGDTSSIERLAWSLLRSPVALERMRPDPTTGEVHYQAVDFRDTPLGGRRSPDTIEKERRLPCSTGGSSSVLIMRTPAR